MFIAILGFLINNFCRHRAISKVRPVVFKCRYHNIHMNLLLSTGWDLIMLQVFIRLSGVTRNTEISLTRTFDISGGKCIKIPKHNLLRMTIKVKYTSKSTCNEASVSRQLLCFLFWFVPGPRLIHINSLIYTFSCIICYIKKGTRAAFLGLNEKT